MAIPTRWAILPAALIALAASAAAAGPSLADLPVASTKLVAPGEYSAAAALAARGGAPLAIALKIVGPFDGSTQHIVQLNEGSEAPSGSRITVMRDGLLDDSVRGERWDIRLEKAASGVWRIAEVKRAWRCWRGAQRDGFAATPCP
jgi:hypothetical protein